MSQLIDESEAFTYSCPMKGGSRCNGERCPLWEPHIDYVIDPVAIGGRYESGGIGYCSLGSPPTSNQIGFLRQEEKKS